jgi:hypothetical protein
MKRFLNYLLLLIFLTSCKSGSNSKEETKPLIKPYPHKINISKGFKNQEIIKLSSIADSIKYIVFSNDVLIRNFPFLQMAKDGFYINPGGLIMKFNLTGKLMHVISKIGRGPEEYPLGSPFSISPYSNKIYVKRNYLGDYLTFSGNGQFSGGIDLIRSGNIWEFLSMNDTSFLYTFSYVGGKTAEEMILCALYDSKGNRIKVVRHPANEIPAGMDLKRLGVSPPRMSFYNNNVVLQHFDTIYKISNNAITPGFILEWDNIPHRQIFEEKFLIQSTSTNKVTQYGKFFETATKAYFGLDDMKKYYLFEYDKITGVTSSMLTGEEDAFGFINDLDGGINFYPKWTNRDGDIWIDYLDAFSFKKYHNDELLSKSESVDPDNKEELRRFLKTLDLTDNPVLKIIYLKKNMIN